MRIIRQVSNKFDCTFVNACEKINLRMKSNPHSLFGNDVMGMAIQTFARCEEIKISRMLTTVISLSRNATRERGLTEFVFRSVAQKLGRV